MILLRAAEHAAPGAFRFRNSECLMPGAPYRIAQSGSPARASGRTTLRAWRRTLAREVGRRERRLPGSNNLSVHAGDCYFGD